MTEDLKSLTERYRRAPDSRLFAPLADAHRKNGDLETAIRILEKGLERFPQYASAHIILGKCFYDKGATERAKAEFARVLELDPENMVALKFMSDILIAEDKRAAAAEYLTRMVAVDPTNEEAARMLKEMEKSFVAKEIDLADGKSARDERPRELATMTLAGIYAAQGYYNKALKIYRDVLEREPGNREAKEMVAKLQSMMDTTEVERDKAFEQHVLSITLDDVSEGIVSSTSGHGGEATPAPQEEEPTRLAGGEEAVRAGETSPPPAAEVKPPPAAEPSPEPEKAEQEEPVDHGMEDFRSWLKKQRSK